MRLFEKKEVQLHIRVTIADNKFIARFTVVESNLLEVFDMFERVIAANEQTQKCDLTKVTMREIRGTNNGKSKSIKSHYIDAYELNKLIKNEIKYNNATNIKPIKDSWSREEVIELFHKYKIYHDGDGSYYKDILNKWLEENL